ncbi:hypothetical protein F7725_007394 [Dissostichus mawsoni]|uniref:Uncharacterized protein n=1 Tax=Dissostichus mawsoni TaxID=36200 RepID=A0A7J5XWQ4_DISMA|nr:hypothetical protein F7725_007394 [Dissostichus mawsoni]
MAAKQGEEQLEDAIFLADLLSNNRRAEQHLAGQNQLGRKRCSGVSSKKEEQKWATCRLRTVAIDSPVTVEPAGATSAVPPQLL